MNEKKMMTNKPGSKHSQLDIMQINSLDFIMENKLACANKV
jgi:hypothetical protein